MKSWIRNTVIGIVIIILAGLLGVRVAHPNGGLSNALGPAHSGLAIYIKGNSPKKGDRVVYSSEDKKISPALGYVFGTNPTYFDVRNGKYLEGIKPSKIRGKLIVVIPFIGWLL
jgi:hypothetical protein